MRDSKHWHRKHANTAERARPDVCRVGEGDLLKLEIAFPAHICCRHTLEGCKKILVPAGVCVRQSCSVDLGTQRA